jgi:hypothetical protein
VRRVAISVVLWWFCAGSRQPQSSGRDDDDDDAGHTVIPSEARDLASSRW